jgi:hypothetical protein
MVHIVSGELRRSNQYSGVPGLTVETLIIPLSGTAAHFLTKFPTVRKSIASDLPHVNFQLQYGFWYCGGKLLD